MLDASLLFRSKLVTLRVLNDIIDTNELGLSTLNAHHRDKTIVANVEHFLDGLLIEGTEGGGGSSTSFFNKAGMTDSPTCNVTLR
jgi:hypothetical protein